MDEVIHKPTMLFSNVPTKVYKLLFHIKLFRIIRISNTDASIIYIHFYIAYAL